VSYAEKTTVSAEKSRAEIEATLLRYGATRFAYMIGGDRAQIAFEANGRLLRFELPLPDPKDRAFTHMRRRGGYPIARSEGAARAAYDQALRQRWRALALCIKAKLEAVEARISTFEDEFLAHIVIPGDGRTAGDWLRPQLALAYETGTMPPLLLTGPREGDVAP